MNISTAKAHMDIPQPVRKSRLANPGWFLVSPSVALLLLWMIVPLGMTVYFSMIRYNLLYPGENEFVGLENFTYFLTDSGFMPGATNTLLLVGSVLLISVVLGVLISALLEASEFLGRGIVRVMLISPFFIMPTVGALIWKNLIFHPVSGILAYVWKLFGAQPVDWLAHYPLLSIIIIVSWQWLPFAILILMTAMQSLDQEQKEAARLDGATLWQEMVRVLLPIAKGGLASTVLLSLILCWNEAFWSLNLTSSKAAPLTALIASYSSPEGLFWAKLSAVSTLACAPILIFGWISQKQLVRGLSFGAVK